jgi:hypothetical protein
MRSGVRGKRRVGEVMDIIMVHIMDMGTDMDMDKDKDMEDMGVKLCRVGR